MRILVYGCGTIGSLLTRYLASTHRLHVYDHNPPKVEALTALSSVKAGDDLAKDVRRADMIVLAVKPQGLETAATELAPHLHEGQVLLSVLAGTTITQLERLLPGPRILRMMPNIAMSVGQSVISLARNPKFSSEEMAEFSQLLGGLGRVYCFDEKNFDAVTALAGSGIGFAFLILEAMCEAGIRLGLKSDTALDLACQTFSGAVALTEKSDHHPADLRWQVCSPGGATIAGVQQLEASAVRAGIMEALMKTYERAVELGKKSEKEKD